VEQGQAEKIPAEQGTVLTKMPFVLPRFSTNSPNKHANIEALLARRQEENKTKTVQDRIADQITICGQPVLCLLASTRVSGSGSCSTSAGFRTSSSILLLSH
jgi:hypothetical protein